jgi:RNA polymerase subunit RPABC4/transcription elongation factor Spt4
MKTKSYTKYLGILLVIVSVFTLFFNWISAARYIKNLQKAASDSLGFFSDYSYTDALIEDAIDSLDDTLDDLRDSAEDLEYYYDIPANKARSVAKKATRILKTIKDFALSPCDAALICADASSILRTAVKYEMISESTTDSDEYKRGKTIMFVISLMFWAALLLGIAALAMRVLGRSQNLDIAYFAVMILLALAAIIVTIWANGKLEDSVLRLTLWPFLGVLCAVPMKLLPNIKASAYTPARANTRANARPSAPALTCASCGSRLDPSERFCSHCGAPTAQARPAAAAICQTCGATVDNGYTFCPNCGSPVTRYAPTSWVCPTCGATLDANTRFCPTCGHPKI